MTEAPQGKLLENPTDRRRRNPQIDINAGDCRIRENTGQPEKELFESMEDIETGRNANVLALLTDEEYGEFDEHLQRLKALFGKGRDRYDFRQAAIAKDRAAEMQADMDQAGKDADADDAAESELEKQIRELKDSEAGKEGLTIESKKLLDAAAATQTDEPTSEQAAALKAVNDADEPTPEQQAKAVQAALDADEEEMDLASKAAGATGADTEDFSSGTTEPEKKAKKKTSKKTTTNKK